MTADLLFTSNSPVECPSAVNKITQIKFRKVDPMVKDYYDGYRMECQFIKGFIYTAT